MRRIQNRKLLAEQLPPGGIGAELGVFRGIFAEELWNRARPAMLHLVDLWDRPFPVFSRLPDGTVERQRLTADAAIAEVGERLAEPIAAGRVQLHQRATVDWLREQPASSLDWVYIDSAHDEPLTTSELCQSYRVVKAGGWICGHDYCSVFPGVVIAVDRFCRDHGLAIDVLTDERDVPLLHRWHPWQPERAAFNSFGIQVRK